MLMSTRRFIVSLLMIIGLPVVILAGVFISILVILYPISYLNGWI